MPLTDDEKRNLEQFISGKGSLYLALSTWCQESAAICNKDCAAALRGPHPDAQAAHYFSARAEVFDNILQLIEDSLKS